MTTVASVDNFPKAVWTGRVLLGLCALFLLFDSVIHIFNPAPVVEGSAKLGFPDRYMTPLGVIELIGLALLLVPRTRVIGALFFTAYLGGATALQIRIGGPAAFSIMVGVLIWIGAYLIDTRIRTVLSPEA